jgi:preprotein translocase subunit Sss1
VFFPVVEMSMLEEVKQVIFMKKKPNRTELPKA